MIHIFCTMVGASADNCAFDLLWALLTWQRYDDSMTVVSFATNGVHLIQRSGNGGVVVEDLRGPTGTPTRVLTCIRKPKSFYLARTLFI